MQLDTNEIETGMVKLLVDIMRHRLSTDANGRPNVIKAYPFDGSNEKGLKPEQPFMTVHVESTTTPYGWLLDRYVDDENHHCYVVAFKIPVVLTAYGRGSHNIITELKQRLEFDSTRNKIDTLTGTRLLDSGYLPNNYDYMNTDYQPFTPLTIDLVCNSVMVDKSDEGGVIERIIADGQLVYAYDQIPPEYEIHIDVKK